MSPVAPLTPPAPGLRRRGAALLTICLLAAVSLAGGCGEEAGGDEPRPRIVATTAIVADIVRRVAGEDAEVTQLVPDSSNPHTYSLSAAEQNDLVESDLLVYFDESLEQGLPLDSAPAALAIAGLPAVDAHAYDEHERGAARANGHGAEQDDGHGHDGADGHDGAPGDEDSAHGHEPGARDPHVWMDPSRIAAALPAIARALGEADPANAGSYRDRARAYRRELERLDAELERTLDAVPPARRKLVTSHDLMGYFADRYGFEFVGAPFGSAPEAEASAGGLAELVDRVRDEGVPVVFAQHGDDPKILRQLGEEAGVTVVDDLLVEGLGPQAGSYAEMMHYTASRIAEALSDGPAGD